MDEKIVSPTHKESQQDKTTEGQRAINLLWERTQSKIALFVVMFTVIVNGAVTLLLVWYKLDMTAGQAMGVAFLNMICGVVISFYFSRTNHAAIGGIGSKPVQEYEGR